MRFQSQYLFKHLYLGCLHWDYDAGLDLATHIELLSLFRPWSWLLDEVCYVPVSDDLCKIFNYSHNASLNMFLACNSCKFSTHAIRFNKCARSSSVSSCNLIGGFDVSTFSIISSIFSYFTLSYRNFILPHGFFMDKHLHILSFCYITFQQSYYF